MIIRRIVFASFFFISLIVLLYVGFLKKREPFVQIPITFFELKNPCIQVEIEGKQCYLALDSGTDLFCSMNKQLLNAIHEKKQTGNIQTADIKGNKYNAPLYIIDSIQIGKIQISNLTVKEENPEFISIGSVLQNTDELIFDNPKISGRIGSKFLRSIDYWLIDLSNSLLVAKRNIDEIKNQNNFIQVELEPIFPHIVIRVQTAIGIKKFALDTGASRSILRTPPEYKGSDHSILITGIFKIGEHDFGATKLYLFEMTSAMEFDGLLGRDFFEKYPIYLDFRKNRVYIKIY